MLRKKQELRLLTVLLVGSLFVHNTSAVNWLPSMSDVTSTASHLLSYPGSIVMQLGGYTGINNLLSRIAPEGWSNMTLQDRQAVVALVSALVSAVLAFVWKHKPDVRDASARSDIPPENPASEKKLSASSQLSDEQKNIIESLEKEITLTNEELKKLIVQLQSSDTTEEQGKLAINSLQEGIKKLYEAINKSYTFMSKEVRDKFNEQLAQIRQGLAVASGNLLLDIGGFIGYFDQEGSSLPFEEKHAFYQESQRFINIIHDYIKNYGSINSDLEGLRQRLLNIQAFLANAGEK